MTIPARLLLLSVRRHVTLACVAAWLATTAVPTPVWAARLRTTHANAEGGVTHAVGVVRAGEAGSAVRGRRLVTDGEGNARVTSGAAVEGANGRSWRRAGRTTKNADGSMAHESGYRASGPRGTVQSHGEATRSAEGDVSATRTTTATSSGSGNSVQITKSYDSDRGASRSVTCFDASGNTIACPQR